MPTGKYPRKPRSEETKRKISLSNSGKLKGRKMPDDVRKKISETLKGKVFSEETRLKISKALTGRVGRKVSDEYKERLRKQMKGNKFALGYKRPLEKILRGPGSPNWKGGIASGENRKKYKLQKCHERRALKLGADGEHSFGEWETLKAQYNWTCPCCKRSEPEIKLTEDHVVPLSKGGNDNIENIQPLCHSCNSRKNVKVIKYEICQI